MLGQDKCKCDNGQRTSFGKDRAVYSNVYIIICAVPLPFVAKRALISTLALSELDTHLCFRLFFVLANLLGLLDLNLALFPQEHLITLRKRLQREFRGLDHLPSSSWIDPSAKFRTTKFSECSLSRLSRTSVWRGHA